MSKEELEEKNRKDALELAKGIFEVVNSPKFKDNFKPEERHKIVIQKYPNFAQAFPVVLRYIARDLRYNEQAFIKFLDKLKTDPGSGMDGFMQRQADYAKFLYLEDCKVMGLHYNMKTANQIWHAEYQNMTKTAKKLEKQEKDARNEFEEMEKKNLELRKAELLNFINTQDPGEKKEEVSEEIDPEILEPANIVLMIRQVKDRRLGLLEEINDKETILTNISQRLNLPEYVKETIPEIEELNLKPSEIKQLEKPKLVELLKKLNNNIMSIETVATRVVEKCEKLEKQYQNIQEKKDVDASWKKHMDSLLNPPKKEKKNKKDKPVLTPEEKNRLKKEKEERRKKEQEELENIMKSF